MPIIDDEEVVLQAKGGSVVVSTGGVERGRVDAAGNSSGVFAGGGGVSSGQEKLNTVASSGSALTVDFSTASTWDITLTAAPCTFTLQGAVAGKECSLTLILRQDGSGSRTVSWPGSVTWLGTGLAPTLQTAASSVDSVVLMSDDGGTTWLGVAQTSTSGLRSGTSFPGSPSDGDLFYRTDRKIIYEYDLASTNWLSLDRKYVPCSGSRVLNGASNVTGIIGFWLLFEDIYIDKWVTLARTGGTNNGSNFSTVTLTKQNAAESSTTITTVSTSADAVSTNVVHTVSVAAVVAAASFPLIFANVTATGAPTNSDFISYLILRAVG